MNPQHETSAQRGAGGGPRSAQWVVPAHWLVMLLILGAAPWAMLLIWMAMGTPGAATSLTSPHGAKPGVVFGSTGPWGDLEYVRIRIGPPASYLVELLNMPSTAWHLGNMTELEVRTLLTTTDMPLDLIDQLLGIARVEPRINGLVIDPPTELVERISPSARAKIYNALALHPANSAQMAAFRIPSTNSGDWFISSNVPEPIRRRVQQLAYPSGRFVFFADLGRVLSEIDSESERVELTRAVAEEPTFLMKLRVRHGQDVSKLAAYWGKGKRNKDVEPLLESLSRLPADHAIDVAHLLPAFARRRLYTYSQPSESAEAAMFDCHWTAMNFFKETPDAEPMTPPMLVNRLAEEYYPIYGDLQLGDLVLYMVETPDAGDVLVHSAVHIADQVVFTKNGSRSTRPWMFMKMADMQDYYAFGRPVKVRYYRHRDL